MNKWKLQIRNKIEDSNIEEPVKALTNSDDRSIRSIAKEVPSIEHNVVLATDLPQLLTYWSTLELSYRIPRKSKIKSVRPALI